MSMFLSEKFAKVISVLIKKNNIKQIPMRPWSEPLPRIN